MVSGSRSVSANINTEVTCELAASSYLNLLPSDGSPVCLWEEDIPAALLSMNLSSSIGKLQRYYNSWKEAGPFVVGVHSARNCYNNQLDLY